MAKLLTLDDLNAAYEASGKRLNIYSDETPEEILVYLQRYVDDANEVKAMKELVLSEKRWPTTGEMQRVKALETGMQDCRSKICELLSDFDYAIEVWTYVGSILANYIW